MKTFSYLFLGTALLGGIAAHADNKWNDDNNPAKMSLSYQYNFYSLPTSGNAAETGKGWSDSYWPKTRGSILDRWQQPQMAYKFNDYKFPSAAEVSRMSQAELNLLSPAEKFDIIRNRFDYPLSNELKKEHPSKADWWKGICNGWTTASLNFNEPKAIAFRSPINGITLPLASGDVKALLDYYYAGIDPSNYKSSNSVQLVGTADRGLNRLTKSAVNDVNAGAFHVVVANEIGIRKQGLAMDMDPGPQTWNQPFLAFETKVTQIDPPSKGHSPGTVKEVHVITTMTYVNELYDTTDEESENDQHVAPTVQALGAGNQHIKKKDYGYTLELDAADRIIGGDWDTYDHPDFIWKQTINPAGMATDTANMRDEANNWTVLAAIVAQSVSP